MASSALFEEFGQRPVPAAVPGVLAILLAVGLGLFGNLNILLAVLWSRRLRSNCHLLLGCTALADLLHQWSHVQFAVRFFAGRAFLPLEDCFGEQAVPVFAMNFGSFAYLVVGLDRLLGVAAPGR